MRLISVWLACSIALFGSPASADRTISIDGLTLARPEYSADVERTTRRSQYPPSQSSFWPPGPIERLLVQRSPAAGPERDPSRSALDSRIADLEAERSAISTRGPRTATIVGAVFTGVGAVVGITGALACAAADSGSGTQCDTANAEIFYITGGGLAGVGLVTLISGATTLKRRKIARSRLDREIRELERKRSTVGDRLDARIQIGRTSMLSLSWSF